MNRSPLTVLLTTRDEEANLIHSLPTLSTWVDQICVLDSESTDRTVEICRQHGAEVAQLPYEHHRIIPWIFQWGLENLAIRNEWVLILEADQSVPPPLRREIETLLAEGPAHQGYYVRRQQVFRGKQLRFGGYGSKRMLKLFHLRHGRLDPIEQDTRVYVDGTVGHLQMALIEWNRKEDRILFYLEKHLRYADAFAREEHRRASEGLAFLRRGRLLGSPDERVLWQKQLWYRLPLFLRPVLYFGYRYFILLGFLDGAKGFLFHFLQAFWFRLVVDVRVAELRTDAEHIEPADHPAERTAVAP